MSEVGEPPRPDLPPLEPWALELEASEAGAVDPRTRDELASVVAVLHSVSEPDPPPGLSDAILTRVAADAARPRVLRAAFAQPGRIASLAMAAGIAGLLALTGLPEAPLPEGAGQPYALGSDGDASDLAIHIPPEAIAAAQRFGAAGLAAAPSYAGDARLVALGSNGLPGQLAGVNAWDRRMDHLLNQLQLDPHAFALRLERMPRRDAFIARLVRRAGERGDAPGIAMRVRESQHPVAVQISHLLLRAALVERVSQQR